MSRIEQQLQLIHVLKFLDVAASTFIFINPSAGEMQLGEAD